MQILQQRLQTHSWCWQVAGSTTGVSVTARRRFADEANGKCAGATKVVCKFKLICKGQAYGYGSLSALTDIGIEACGCGLWELADVVTEDCALRFIGKCTEKV